MGLDGRFRVSLSLGTAWSEVDFSRSALVIVSLCFPLFRPFKPETPVRIWSGLPSRPPWSQVVSFYSRESTSARLSLTRRYKQVIKLVGNTLIQTFHQVSVTVQGDRDRPVSPTTSGSPRPGEADDRTVASRGGLVGSGVDPR